MEPTYNSKKTLLRFAESCFNPPPTYKNFKPFRWGSYQCMSSLQGPPGSVGFDGEDARRWVVWGDTGMP